ncbi:MAG TPA: nitroreductase family protein [Candidatus Deferrimicrobium sp.]|nr:nitroreductase family protein [Candidatus Deferrimicrobium sp.]
MNDSIFFSRHSKRSYLDKPVPQEALDRIFEKIRWTPSCGNAQPWRFVFVREASQRAAFLQALSRGNQWADKAPVLIAVCGRPSDDHARTDDPVSYYQFDCGMATLSLLLAAVDEGLMAHPMAGYDAPGVKNALDIPAEFHVLCVVALGYEGPIDLLDDATRKKDEAARTRKEIQEIIATDRFMF